MATVDSPGSPTGKMLAHDRLADRFDELMNDYDVTRRVGVVVDTFLSEADVCRRLVTRARRRCACRPVVGSVMSFSFQDATFDVVLSTEVIEHVPHPPTAVREFARVLKSGGHLVLSTPNRLWQTPVRLASALRIRPYNGLENFLTTGELQTTASHAACRWSNTEAFTYSRFN